MKSMKKITRGTGKSEIVAIRIKKEDLENFEKDAIEKKLPIATYLRLLIYKGFNDMNKKKTSQVVKDVFEGLWGIKVIDEPEEDFMFQK